ncbi:hypothetical protein D3C81_1197520 [compost metagenome]
MDLFRFISVKMSTLEVGEQASSMFVEKFLPVIDELQLALDKKHFSSEVHILFRKKVTGQQ